MSQRQPAFLDDTQLGAIPARDPADDGSAAHSLASVAAGGTAPGARPKRLLALTYHYPPDGSVGGLRWSGLSKYLVRQGWEVHVITASAQQGPDVPGVNVHHCPRAETLNDRYNRVVERWRVNRPTPAPSVPAVDSGGPNARRQRATFLRRARWNLAVSLAFPDYGRGWTFRAMRAAQALLKSKTFDVVVSSGPPHSAHIAGALALIGRTEPLFVDMRDPWVTQPGGLAAIAALRNMTLARLLFGIERFVLRRAAQVITNTAEFAEVLRSSFPGLDVSYIPNGIDRERLPKPVERFAELSIAYAGTLYLNRDLSAVVRALAELMEQMPETRTCIKLRVAGSMEASHEARFRQQVNDAGLTHAVDIRGRIPGAAAIDLINRSHLALVLAQAQPTQIPAKLYECVAMGVPTLVIAEASSAAAREAIRIGAMTCEPDDIPAIRGVIERIWANPNERPASASSIGYDAVALEMGALLGSAV